MTLKSTIKDGRGSGNLAGLSDAGELLIKGIGINQSNNQTLAIKNQAYNFFFPLAGFTFMITSITFSANANTTITIFAAPSATSTVIDNELFTQTTGAAPAAITAVINLPFGGFLSVGEGEFLNATSNVVPVQMTITGYYAPV